MIRYITFLAFVLSVAIASGIILLATRLRNNYKNEAFSSLFYFQVFTFTFGFYGIWGQSVINLILSPYITRELLQKFSEIALLLGLPFIVFAWFMLLEFSAYLSGGIFSKRMTIMFLIINISVIFAVGYNIADREDIRPVYLIKYYFIVMNFLYSVVSALIILLPKKNKILVNSHDRMIISSGIVFVMIIQMIVLLFYDSQVYVGLIFILAFFAGNSFITIYLNYGAILKPLKQEVITKDSSFDAFCRKYEVSPREKDIILEICNGLSNKEISEKLFISLQTVKDHTHRIYIKTNLRSRVQLINLVKEKTSPA